MEMAMREMVEGLGIWAIEGQEEEEEVEEEEGREGKAVAFEPLVGGPSPWTRKPHATSSATSPHQPLGLLASGRIIPPSGSFKFDESGNDVGNLGKK
jgi:hypothetical protein